MNAIGVFWIFLYEKNWLVEYFWFETIKNSMSSPQKKNHQILKETRFKKNKSDLISWKKFAGVVYPASDISFQVIRHLEKKKILHNTTFIQMYEKIIISLVQAKMIILSWRDGGIFTYMLIYIHTLLYAGIKLNIIICSIIHGFLFLRVVFDIMTVFLVKN